LIPHGTAMDNTMRQIAASIGTAILVTTMTTVAQKTAQSPAIENPEIHGVNVAFFVITAISLVGIVLAFFSKKTTPPTEEEYAKMSRETQQAEDNIRLKKGTSQTHVLFAVSLYELDYACLVDLNVLTLTMCTTINST